MSANIHAPLFAAIDRIFENAAPRIITPATQEAVTEGQRKLLEREERQKIALAMRSLSEALMYPDACHSNYSEAIANIKGAWAARNLLDPEECESDALAEWITVAKNAQGERDHFKLKCERMKGVLTECAEYLDDEVDVKDGDDGVPEANKAMSLVQAIEEFL